MSKFYGKAEQAARTIVEAFESGNLPKALAPIFIRRKDNVPCRQWSWSNQLLTALAGHSDARGFRQWEEAGRHVKKGEKSFPILAPLTRKIEATDPESGEKNGRIAVYGFKHVCVFGVTQTEGDELPAGDPEADGWIDRLPLLGVARDWGLTVNTYNGQTTGAKGWYKHGQSIALGVENLSTWTHEMIHAADDRLGSLTERGQHWRSEVVAELGGAILLECLGHESDADRGGCWDYVKKYARDAEIEPVAACQRVLKRTCDAVALILETAEQLAAPQLAECQGGA